MAVGTSCCWDSGDMNLCWHAGVCALWIVGVSFLYAGRRQFVLNFS